MSALLSACEAIFDDPQDVRCVASAVAQATRFQARYEAWRAQFLAADRDALDLLKRSLKRYDRSDVQTLLRTVHAGLVTELGDVDGRHVVFSFLSQCQSGALVSYHYRQVNSVPDTQFQRGPWDDDAAGKTLVVIDDYVGTGLQFMQHLADLRGKFGVPFATVICAPMVANPKAFDTFRMIREQDFDGLHRDMAHFIGSEFAATANIEKFKAAKLHELDIRLLPAVRERTLLEHVSDEFGVAAQKHVRTLLQTYAHPSIRFDEIGTRTVFEHNAPNQLPAILWNSSIADENANLAGLKGRGFLPLFNRHFDRSNYAFTFGMPDSRRIWNTEDYDATKYAFYGDARTSHPGDRGAPA